MKTTHIWLPEGEPTQGPWIEQFKYPAGEWQVRLTPTGYRDISSSDLVRISADVRSGDDLYRLALLVDAVEHCGEEPPKVEVAMPYLFASRADRRFVPGDCAGLDVVLRMLGGVGPDGDGLRSLRTLDAHNPKLTEGYNGLKNISPLPFIHRTIINVALRENTDEIAIVYPDEGASKRYAIPRQIGNNHRLITLPIYYGVKTRDVASGKITGYKLPYIPYRVVLVVDDICDGGRTFEEVGKHFRPGQSAYLYVTHGIFSKGLDSLLKIYRRIYTTNTFDDVSSEYLIRFNASEEIWK